MTGTGGLKIALAAVLLVLSTCSPVKSLPVHKFGWPKADRWVSWWFMPRTVNYTLAQSEAVVACVQNHTAAFDSMVIYCGHRLAPNGSLTVDLPFLEYVNSTMLVPISRIGVVMECAISGGDENIVQMRKSFSPQNIKYNAEILVSATRDYGIQGWSFDWEPTCNDTHKDRLDYATMLGQLRSQLSPLGARVTLDTFGPNSALLGGYKSMAPNVDMLYDMETYDTKGNYTWWLEQYEKFVNNSGTDKFGDSSTFPVNKASIGFDVYESAAQNDSTSLLGPRIQRMLKDKVPELFIFQFWQEASGTVDIKDFWYEHVETYKRGIQIQARELTMPLLV